MLWNRPATAAEALSRPCSFPLPSARAAFSNANLCCSRSDRVCLCQDDRVSNSRWCVSTCIVGTGDIWVISFLCQNPLGKLKYVSFDLLCLFSSCIKIGIITHYYPGLKIPGGTLLLQDWRRSLIITSVEKHICRKTRCLGIHANGRLKASLPCPSNIIFFRLEYCTLYFYRDKPDLSERTLKLS